MAKRSALRKRRKKRGINNLVDLLKKLGNRRTSNEFILPQFYASIDENEKFNVLLDLYSKCFIFDVYQKKNEDWYGEATFFYVENVSHPRILIASLNEDFKKQLENKKAGHNLVNLRPIIPLRDMVQVLGDGNSDCRNCSLQSFLKIRDKNLATEISRGYRGQRECEKCITRVIAETLNSPNLFFKEKPILIAERKYVELAKALAGTREEVDSEAIACLILLYHENIVEVAIKCDLTNYSLSYGECFFNAGEIDVLVLKGNKITQIEITKTPYKENKTKEWIQHQQKAYNRHFILKSIKDHSVKTIFLFPHIGKKVKITPKSQIKKQFEFYPIQVTFNFKKDVENAKKQLKKLIKNIG